MAPGITVTMLFIDRVTAVITDPRPATFITLAAFAAMLVAVAVLVHRRFSRPDEPGLTAQRG
jgi:hypothetical protein